jgi:hypothetical protein
MPGDDDRHSLRIRALRGGSVSEVATFLVDLEGAYNALYWFSSGIHGFFRHGPLYISASPPFQVGQADQIVPERRLQLIRVSIQSHGFWEVLGSLNPLLQIREYLKDRHERRKDRAYREPAEAERLRLENEVLQRTIRAADLHEVRETLEMLREFGDDERVEQLLWSQLGPPLARLGRHQDSGLIEGPEDDGKEQHATSEPGPAP